MEREQASAPGSSLGCKLNEHSGIVTESLKRTSNESLYAYSDTLMSKLLQLIIKLYCIT